MEYIDEAGLISPIKGSLGIKTAITTFSKHLFDELLARTGARHIHTLAGASAIDVYAFEQNGKRIAVYMSPIGAPAAAAALEEVGGQGITEFVAFGICGSLTNIPTRKIVVPTHSLRDEGTSKSYVPSSEFITLKNAARVENALKGYGVEVVTGGCWTTDAFYRETRTHASIAVNRGCIVVDMESAALQAVCDFRGYGFNTFFITADSLAGEKWEPNYILDPTATDAEALAVAAAVRLACDINSESV